MQGQSSTKLAQNARDFDCTPDSTEQSKNQDHAAHPKVLARLIELATEAIRSGVADSPTDNTDNLKQIERVLVRIAAGQGAPVSLPDIQHPGNGRRFIADVQARLWAIRHIYGFNVEMRA